MTFTFANLSRAGALLAINLVFLMMWGFAGIGKVKSGYPSWFDGKFEKTILGQFPGLTASFWLLTVAELLAFALALVALVRGEFVRYCRPFWLTLMLVWSLLVFVMLSFGQWLSGDPTGPHQLFTFFGFTLLALHFVRLDMTPRGPLVIEK